MDEGKLFEINKQLEENLKSLHSRKDEIKQRKSELEQNLKNTEKLIERLEIVLSGFKNAGFAKDRGSNSYKGKVFNYQH